MFDVKTRQQNCLAALLKRLISYISVIALITLSLTLPALGGEVKLHVEADRSHIYLGDSIILQVKVSGTRTPSEPDLSAIKDCRLRFRGSQDSSSYSFVMINGRIQRTGSSSRVFTYEVAPLKPGKFTAGPVKLSVKDKTISAHGPTIEVAGIQDQDWVEMRITASRESVLVDEPFEITLSIAMKRLKGRYADADPLDPADPPTLIVPYLDNEPIPGLDSPDIRRILRENLVPQRNRPGFAINNYTIQKDPFDFDSMFDFDDFMVKRKAKFRFDRRVKEKNGQSYLEYTLKLTYVPKEEGNYTFGPAEFKGKAVAAVDSGGHIIGKRIFTVGPACTVRVVPPPEQGRPPSYIGAIGTNLVVEASLDTQTCNVGDPLTLTLKISGNVSMGNIRPPLLNAQPDLVRHFRIYEDTVRTITKNGVKEYVYTIRPTEAGTLELPPIKVSYYDADERTYKTVKTQPVPIRANKAVEVAGDIIIDTATNRVTLGGKPSTEEIFIVAPLNVDPAGAEPAGISGGKWHIVLAALGPLAYLLTIAIQYMRTHAAGNAQTQRKRNAADRAFARLRDADKLASTNPDKVRGLVCEALKGYLGDRFDLTEAGITPADARKVLYENKIDAEPADRFCEIFERNFNAGYAQDKRTDIDPVQDIKNARAILEKIDSLSSL